MSIESVMLFNHLILCCPFFCLQSFIPGSLSTKWTSLGLDQGVGVAMLLPEVLGENHFFAFPALRGHQHALACGPFLHLPASSIASSKLPLVLTLPPPSPTLKSLVSPLGPPGKSRVTSPSQGHPTATLVSSANFIPLCRATQRFHRFQGLGCQHLWGTNIELTGLPCWLWASLLAQMVENLPARQKTRVWSPVQEDRL